VQDLLGAFCRAAGVPAPALSVPAALGVVPTLWAELAMAALGQRAPLPGLIPLLICEQARHGPAQGDPGLPAGGPRPLATTVRDTIAWYRAAGYC
jgi:hypothetical protein